MRAWRWVVMSSLKRSHTSSAWPGCCSSRCRRAAACSSLTWPDMSSRAGDWARAREEEEVELVLIFRVFILLPLDTFLGTTVGVAGAQMDTCKHGSTHE